MASWQRSILKAMPKRAVVMLGLLSRTEKRTTPQFWKYRPSILRKPLSKWRLPRKGQNRTKGTKMLEQGALAASLMRNFNRYASRLAQSLASEPLLARRPLFYPE